VQLRLKVVRQFPPLRKCRLLLVPLLHSLTPAFILYTLHLRSTPSLCDVIVLEQRLMNSLGKDKDKPSVYYTSLYGLNRTTKLPRNLAGRLDLNHHNRFHLDIYILNRLPLSPPLLPHQSLRARTCGKTQRRWSQGDTRAESRRGTKIHTSSPSNPTGAVCWSAQESLLNQQANLSIFSSHSKEHITYPT
jgi:hypothetical protein